MRKDIRQFRDSTGDAGGRSRSADCPCGYSFVSGKGGREKHSMSGKGRLSVPWIGAIDSAALLQIHRLKGREQPGRKMTRGKWRAVGNAGAERIERETGL